jgi:hypothetical protein
MTAPDSRGRWFRVYARQVRQHPKFRDMTALELGAWTVLRSEAELRDGAQFLDRSEAVLILKRRHAPRAAALLDGLIERHLFDEHEDGSVHVHDREDHDRPKYPSDDPEKVRDRVAKHRAEKAEKRGNEEGNESVTNEETTLARGPASGAGAGAASSSASEPENETRAPDEAPTYPWGEPDTAVGYMSITGRYPSDGVLDWLDRLENDHPAEAIIAELARQHAENSNLGTLLSRTEKALKLDARRRQKADERARAKARVTAEAPHRKLEREATPEERERAKLQQQAIRIGLALKVDVPTDPEEVRKFVMKHGAVA